MRPIVCVLVVGVLGSAPLAASEQPSPSPAAAGGQSPAPALGASPSAPVLLVNVRDLANLRTELQQLGVGRDPWVEVVIWGALAAIGVAFAVAWGMVRQKEESTKLRLAEIEAPARAAHALWKDLLEASQPGGVPNLDALGARIDQLATTVRNVSPLLAAVDTLAKRIDQVERQLAAKPGGRP